MFKVFMYRILYGHLYGRKIEYPHEHFICFIYILPISLNKKLAVLSFESWPDNKLFCSSKENRKTERKKRKRKRERIFIFISHT